MARRPLIPAEEGQIMDAAALGHPEIRTMEIRSLKPAKYNPRRIDQAAIAGLERSMERFGLDQNGTPPPLDCAVALFGRGVKESSLNSQSVICREGK